MSVATSLSGAEYGCERTVEEQLATDLIDTDQRTQHSVPSTSESPCLLGHAVLQTERCQMSWDGKHLSVSFLSLSLFPLSLSLSLSLCLSLGSYKTSVTMDKGQELGPADWLG